MIWSDAYLDKFADAVDPQNVEWIGKMIFVKYPTYKKS